MYYTLVPIKPINYFKYKGLELPKTNNNHPRKYIRGCVKYTIALNNYFNNKKYTLVCMYVKKIPCLVKCLNVSPIIPIEIIHYELNVSYMHGYLHKKLDELNLLSTIDITNKDKKIYYLYLNY